MKFCTFLFCVLTFMSSSFAFKITDLKEIEGNEYEITEIDLSNKGLSEFPKEILNCKNLVSLKLTENGIINLPIELGDLNRLKELDFSNNQSLSYSDLEDLFEKATFQLESLDVSDCEMGYIPNQIGRQKSLVNLNVSGNLLNNLPYPVIQLTKLEVLDASNNKIADLSWQVHQWWNLRRLDVSNNPSLKTTELLFSLSVTDGLDQLILSHVQEFPSEFKGLNVAELEIRNSHITNFPRVENSTPIKKLTFINCSFNRPGNVAKIINDYVQPEFLRLNELKGKDLMAFLPVNVDSVDLRNNNLQDIRILAGVKQLKWVDARGNNISDESVTRITETRADLELLLSEPVVTNKGIDPPFEQFVQMPTVKIITANQENQVQMGRSTFNIPEGAFLDQDGNVYSGEVALSYTEYVTPAEVFFSGITMTSDSADENLVFSSAGMFNFEAEDNVGNELQMNTEAPVSVKMMSSNPSPDMNLYALNEDGVWDYKGKDEINEPFKIDMSKVDSAANSAYLNFDRKNIVITQNRFVPSVKGDGKAKSFTIAFNELETNKKNKPVQVDAENCFIKRPGNVSSFIATSTFLYDGTQDSATYYKKWFKKVQRYSRKSYNKLRNRGSDDYAWGINYISKLDLAIDTKTDRIRLNFLFKDSAVSVPVVLKSNPENPKGRMKIFQRFFKVFSWNKKRDEHERKNRSRHAMTLIKKEEIEIRNLGRRREMARQKAYFDQNEYFSTIANIGSVERSFELTGFGVWNCDQRSRMMMPVNLPTNLIAENGEAIHDSIHRVSVIDFEKNGVFSYYNKNNAAYDKGSSKTAIVIFFSSVSIGIYKTWKKLKNLKGENSDEMVLRRLDVSKMNVRSLTDFIEN